VIAITFEIVNYYVLKIYYHFPFLILVRAKKRIQEFQDKQGINHKIYNIKLTLIISVEP